MVSTGVSGFGTSALCMTTANGLAIPKSIAGIISFNGSAAIVLTIAFFEQFLHCFDKQKLSAANRCGTSLNFPTSNFSLLQTFAVASPDQP